MLHRSEQAQVVSVRKALGEGGVRGVKLFSQSYGFMFSGYDCLCLSLWPKKYYPGSFYYHR